MSMINIQGTKYSYDEREIINFSEGLIGFPEMRRAVLIPLAEYEPFCWLAAIDDEKIRFIVVNPREIFADYAPDSKDDEQQTLAIVKISSDWQKTTVNLRAPIFVNPKTQRAAQIILDKSDYKHAEALPNN
ncbi:MAG: flagellar assembly protein FliW [Pyrinomonadaceae bacterium]